MYWMIKFSSWTGMRTIEVCGLRLFLEFAKCIKDSMPRRSSTSLRPQIELPMVKYIPIQML